MPLPERRVKRWHVPGLELVALPADTQLTHDACEEFFQTRNKMLENAAKSLIMFGWATDEITHVYHRPGFRETLNVDGAEVFEADFVHPEFVGYGLEKYEITVTGRWISWPYKY